MTKIELRSLIREEIKKALKEGQKLTSPEDIKLRNKYVNAWIIMAIDPIGYQYRDDLFTTKALPDESDIVEHAKMYGYWDALQKLEIEIGEMPEVEATHPGRNVSVSTFRSKMSDEQKKQFVMLVKKKISPAIKRELGIK